MSNAILNMEVHLEHDVVLARQRARQIASILGFDLHDQTRIATAVSEIARNAFQYARGGKIEFRLEDALPHLFLIRIRDRGPGITDLQSILDGVFQSSTGLGMGIAGVRRLMDRFHIESTPGVGTMVELGKNLPKSSASPGMLRPAKIAEELVRQGPQSPFEEVRQQNQDLVRLLAELQQRQMEMAALNEELKKQQEVLTQLNRELEDTNRGVVALYAELDEKADFLRRTSEMKSRFLSNMSHEFRTPLNSITGLSRLLLDRTDGELTPEQEKQISLILRSTNGLTDLVNDLLDIARVEAGKVVVRPVEFDIGTLFGALRGMLRPLLAHNSSVALVFDVPQGLPCLHTDESKVSQILRNFISNALKFTDRGEVRVSAELENEQTIVFSVADTGIGIALEDQERIFDEFTQIESPRQKRVKGSGLGLPLVRRLAGLLGGRVVLKSELGVGSTFSVHLPCCYEGPSEVSFVPELSTQLDPTRLPVLVIEDNRETLFIYEKYLKGTGFQVIPARTLRAARLALSQFRPLAVVLDVLLEGESTWELLSQLKRTEATRNIPILVVTMVANENKALALGANAFCAKPVDRAWLLEKLRQAALPDFQMKVLLIDDDEASRYLLKDLLTQKQLNVFEAVNGLDGLRQARLQKPDVIFLDLDLPDMNGYAVLEELHRDETVKHIPVMINTSERLDTQITQRLKDSGVIAILSKESASRADSLQRIDEALRRAGLGTTVVESKR